MRNQQKINTVQEYLETAFPDGAVYNFNDFDRDNAHSFRIEHNGATYLTTVTRQFLDDHTEVEVGTLVADFGLHNALLKAGGLRVLLTNDGLR